MIRFVLAAALTVAVLAPAAAGEPDMRRPAAADRRAGPVPAGSTFYPAEVEGGVSNNLPFNNQIRKHTDPLNANGGR